MCYWQVGDDNQSKRHAYQTDRGAVSDYIQRYIITYPGNSWEQLKSELNVRLAEVNDTHEAFTMLHKARQVKHEPVQVYTGRMYALANDAFTNVHKAVIKSQLVVFFIDGLYHDFLHMKVIRETKKHFRLQYSLH